MWSFRPRTAVAVAILALSTMLAGGVVAATQPSDERALQPTRQPANRSIDSQVNRLLSRMTLEDPVAAGRPCHRSRGAQGARLDPERDRPGAYQRASAHCRRRVAPEDPAAVRVRH